MSNVLVLQWFIFFFMQEHFRVEMVIQIVHETLQ